MSEIPPRYFANDNNFPPTEVLPLVTSLMNLGFHCSEVDSDINEVAKLYSHPNGDELLIIASLQPISGLNVVEVTGDFPTGPIIRDRQ